MECSNSSSVLVSNPVSSSASSSASSSSSSCIPCKDINNLNILNSNDINNFLYHSKYWKLNKEKNSIHRYFIAKNFQIGLNFINEVGKIAERTGHHPDMHITSYRNIEV